MADNPPQNFNGDYNLRAKQRITSVIQFAQRPTNYIRNLIDASGAHGPDTKEEKTQNNDERGRVIRPRQTISHSGVVGKLPPL